MSAGRSSHDSACFSVDRTKYLMLSKSMPDRSAPQVGIGLRPKYLQALEPQFSSIHSRLVLACRDVADHLFGQSALGGRAGHVGVGPAELVRAQTFELVIRGGRHMVRALRTRWWSSLTALTVQVTCVVQIPSPCAMVASRWTGRAEQPAERLGLRLAQLGELGRDVRDRAVVLADLLADQLGRADAPARGRPRRRSRRRTAPPRGPAPGW